MDDSKVQPQAGYDERSLHTDGVPVQGEAQPAHQVGGGRSEGEAGSQARKDKRERATPGELKAVDVVTVHDSWWPTRVKQGVHIKYTTEDRVEFAKHLAVRLGTNTVYVYKPS